MLPSALVSFTSLPAKPDTRGVEYGFGLDTTQCYVLLMEVLAEAELRLRQASSTREKSCRVRPVATGLPYLAS